MQGHGYIGGGRVGGLKNEGKIDDTIDASSPVYNAGLDNTDGGGAGQSRIGRLTTRNECGLG